MQPIQALQNVTGGYCYNNYARYPRQTSRYSPAAAPRYNCNTRQAPSYAHQPSYYQQSAQQPSPYQNITFNFYNPPATYNSWTVTWYNC